MGTMNHEERNKAFDATIKTVLTEHLQAGVLVDTDLWPALRERLPMGGYNATFEHTNSIEDKNKKEAVVSTDPAAITVITRPASRVGRMGPRWGLKLRRAGTVAGLLAAMLVAIFTISVLLLRSTNSVVLPVPLTQGGLPIVTVTIASPASVPTGAVSQLQAPVSTEGRAYYVSPMPSATLGTRLPTPRPLWDMRSLVFNASVVAEAQIIGSEKRTGSYTFIFYVHKWYKNEPGVKDNIVRLTLDTTKNWDKLPFLPRNLIGGDGPYPFNFMLFLSGSADNYFILGNTAGIFYLPDNAGVEAGGGAEQYQNMPVKTFQEEVWSALPATPTALPLTPTPLPTPSDGSPISLIKVGDGYQVYVHRGTVRLGVGGMPVWVGPSQLQIQWSSGKEPYEGASYLVDLRAGTIEKYNPARPEWEVNTHSYSSVPHPDGKQALLLKGGTEDVWGVTYYDVATKQEQTVYDRNASVPQWAGTQVHEPGIALSPASPLWLSEDTFLLLLGPSPVTGEPRGKGALLLVNVSNHTVRLLTKEGSSYTAQYGLPVVYQTGDISSPLLMLPAPYTGTPITLTSGGPWIRDWTATPEGRRVAWVEATPPPGDWSKRLPSPCIPCEGPGPKDPEPDVQAIAIWDAATGKVYRYKPSGLVWSLGSAYFMQQEQGGLHWRVDGATLLYATHTSGTPGRSNLYGITPGGQPEILAQHPWDGTIHFLGEGKEGSLYYWVTGRGYYASGDLVQRHPDGSVEVLHENLTSNMWWVEQGKWLEVLQEGAVTIHDFATGTARYARFSDHAPSPGELGWSGVQDLVPVSPDGMWAAYAGTNSDAVVVSPDGKPDRGRAMLIVRIK